MTVIDRWTGASATALRLAMRLSVEGYSAKLGVSERAISKWAAKPDLEQTPQYQQILDTAYARCDISVLERFTALTRLDADSADSSEPLGPTVLHALDWIDTRAGWPSGTAERRVRSATTVASEADRHRLRARRRVPRSRLAAAVTALYPDTDDTHLYSAVVDGQRVRTSVLTTNAWTDLASPMNSETEQFVVDYASPALPKQLSAEQANAAVGRILEVVGSRARIFNAELYTLLDIRIGDYLVRGTLGLTSFIPYALTTDLLEDELAAQAVLNNPALRS